MLRFDCVMKLTLVAVTLLRGSHIICLVFQGSIVEEALDVLSGTLSSGSERWMTHLTCEVVSHSVYKWAHPNTKQPCSVNVKPSAALFVKRGTSPSDRCLGSFFVVCTFLELMMPRRFTLHQFLPTCPKVTAWFMCPR